MKTAVQIVIPAFQPTFELFDLVSKLIEKADTTKDIDLTIVVVNDGSTTKEAQEIFKNLVTFGSRVILLEHTLNRGKGSALRTAFRYLKENFKTNGWVVTADADGQHLPLDIWKVVSSGKRFDSPVIGTRTFGKSAPLRSRFGNIITQFVFNFIHKTDLSDTQTGLRGFHSSELEELISLKTEGYAYETDALVALTKKGDIRQIPITTVYAPGNPTSHFKVLADSVSIYFVLIRHLVANSFAMLIEVSLFSLLIYVGASTAVSLPLARIVSAATSFKLARSFVFNSEGNFFIQAAKYVSLVALNLFIAINIIELIVKYLNVNEVFGLFGSYFFLFIINFFIQRILIFK